MNHRKRLGKEKAAQCKKAMMEQGLTEKQIDEILSQDTNLQPYELDLMVKLKKGLKEIRQLVESAEMYGLITIEQTEDGN